MVTPPEHISPDRADVASKAAQAGGEILKQHFGRELQSQRKLDDSIVTQADLAAEQAVLEVIRASFPQDLILAEEAGEPMERKPGAHIWVIDPLDGTSNFFYGLGYFCCSVGCGVVQDDRSIAMHSGAVDAPIQGKHYEGRRNGGARVNGEVLQVSDSSDRPFEHLFFSMGLYYGGGDRLERELKLNQQITRRCQSIRRLGAAALELCMVAEGVFDAYWQEGLQPWDVGAASVIIEEAGGKVLEYSRAEFDIEAGSIVAGSADVVDRLRELI